MIDLHFICPHGQRHVHLGKMVFETSAWIVSNERADEAIGGRIYLHEHKDTPAWHGGTIQSWRAVSEKRKAFIYKTEGDFRVICPGGWGQEQATVRR